jgi:hypothetical protein
MAPSSYTDTTLKEYMHTTVAGVAAVLEWSVAGGSYDEPLNDVLLGLGLDDASGATNVRLLRAAAKVAVWRAALGALAAHVDETTDEDSFRSSQMHEMARRNLDLAEQELREAEQAALAAKSRGTQASRSTQHKVGW